MRPWSVLVSVCLVATPAVAQGFTVVTRTSSSAFRARMKAQVYARSRGRQRTDRDTEWDHDLQRARLELTIDYDRWLRLTIEPDFAGATADLADVFLQVEPIKRLQVRLGQAKTPFGAFEIESRWALPVTTRGVINEVVSDRLGFGGRRFGGKIRYRPKIALRPTFEVGVYSDQVVDVGEDGAARVTLRPVRGLMLEAAGYLRASAATDGGHGYAGAFAATYERFGVHAIVEGLTGRARLLRIDGVDTGQDATFFGARLIASYRVEVVDDVAVSLGAGFDVLDPNMTTRDDLGLNFRGAINAIFLNALRLSFEVDRVMGQTGFVRPDETTYTAFVGMRLK